MTNLKSSSLCETHLKSTSLCDTALKSTSLGETDQYLRKLYYGIDSPTAYTSMANLWKQIKHDKKEITRETLKKWLEDSYVYSLHKPYKQPKLYRKTMISGIDDQWQADLVEMREFSDSNAGNNYILCVIDCFSKFAWCVQLKTKTGAEVKAAFENIFNQGRVPDKIQFDEGKEFYNAQVKSLLNDKSIEFFSTHAGEKASIVERFNRSLKSRMFKYFTANETRKWIDIVDNLVNDYNNTYHRTIKMSPIEASKPENSLQVWCNIYGAYLAEKYGVPAYKVGQTVRIIKYKSIFDKGYLPNFTEEFSKIKQVKIGRPTVYILEDLKGDDVVGIFYEEELSPYNETDETTYNVEKVLGKKTVKGKKFVLVKYKGWPDKFNEWLPAENVTNK